LGDGLLAGLGIGGRLGGEGGEEFGVSVKGWGGEGMTYSVRRRHCFVTPSASGRGRCDIVRPCCHRERHRQSSQ